MSISILNLSTNSIVFMMAPNAVKLYMHLLASVSPSKELLISKQKEKDLPGNYSRYIDFLKESKVIHVSKDGTIYLGEEGKLFANEIDMLSHLREELDSLFKEYSGRRRKNVDIIESWSRASRMLTTLENIKRGYDLLTLYKGVYAVVNRAIPDRDFTAKEVGQLNTLLRLYGTEKAVQLICYYLLNYTEETCNPTINQLVGQKDALFSDMRKSSKKTTRDDISLYDADEF